MTSFFFVSEAQKRAPTVELLKKTPKHLWVWASKCFQTWVFLTLAGCCVIYYKGNHTVQWSHDSLWHQHPKSEEKFCGTLFTFWLQTFNKFNAKINCTTFVAVPRKIHFDISLLFFYAGLTFPDLGVASGFLWGAHNCMIKGVRIKPGNTSRRVWDRSALGMQGKGGGRCTLWDKQREYFASKRISSEIVNRHFYIS